MRIDSKGYRPDCIADILPHARHREARGMDFGLAFDMAKREFLDAFYIMEDAQRAESLQAEPERVGPLEDTQLGALAEQLARNFRLPLPAWTEQPWRFLKQPVFASGDIMKGVLLMESPAAFRRRGLFCTGNVLARASILQAKPNHGEPVAPPPLVAELEKLAASPES